MGSVTGRIPWKYLRRDFPDCTAYESLDVVHHGKVPAYSGSVTFDVYYTRNGLSPHWNVIIEIGLKWISIYLRLRVNQHLLGLAGDQMSVGR